MQGSYCHDGVRIAWACACMSHSDGHKSRPQGPQERDCVSGAEEEGAETLMEEKPYG